MVAATNVNSPEQDIAGTLQSTFTQEPKPKLGASLERDEESQVVIITGGVECNHQSWSSEGLCSYCAG